MNEADSLTARLQQIDPCSITKFILNVPSKNSAWRKISAIRLRNGVFQVEKFTEKQSFHEKIVNIENLFQHDIFSLFGTSLMQMEIFSNEFSYSFRAAKKRILFKKSKLKNPSSALAESQDRTKNHLLQSGMQIPALVDLGIFHNDFTIVKKASAKFKQINRFLEFADDMLKKHTPPSDRPFTIVDFGCGKSYLTFILYYYFTEIRKWNIRMIGMDLKEDVITNCKNTAAKYNYDKLDFICGDIGNYADKNPVDMIITLHACDTATDYALFHAVKRQVRYILSVPCCQHELNYQFKSKNLKVLGDYGIIRERFSALLTDTIRAELLKSRNYGVQILEFVDLSHTPKNLLIRAELNQQKSTACAGHLANVKNLMQEFSLSPTLFNLLEKN